MKIVLFTDSLGAGGAQRQLVGLAKFLKDVGHSVKVLTYFDEPFFKPYLDEHDVYNEVIKHADNTKLRIPIVCGYLYKHKPDLLISYQETPSLVACVAKALGAQFKLIVSERNTTQKISLNEKVRFFLYHMADCIVPNSYTQESFLASNYPWMKSKIKTITNFVDLEKFHFEIRTKSLSPTILVVASIWPPKNTLGLIEAVKILKNDGHSFHIKWYGKLQETTEYVEKCKQLIQKYEIEDYIELMNKVPNIQEKYVEADFVCLPSFYEGTPNVICEAIASGRPVICSNVCDNHFYVEEDLNGYLFDPYKPQSIAIALKKLLLLDEKEYKLMCTASRIKAESLLSIESFVQKYINVINTI